MKYNLRNIKGKRIVGGDPNLATKNEIHVSKIPEELGIGGNTESSEGVKYYYYKYVNSEDAWGAFTMFCGQFYMEYLRKGVDGNNYITLDRPGEPGDLVAFKLVGVPQITSYEIMGTDIPTSGYVRYDGDIFSRITKVAAAFGGEMTEDQARELFKASFVEISKEEYDTLYTKLDIL